MQEAKSVPVSILDPLLRRTEFLPTNHDVIHQTRAPERIEVIGAEEALALLCHGVLLACEGHHHVSP